jgi:potassium efflux system protein
MSYEMIHKKPIKNIYSVFIWALVVPSLLFFEMSQAEPEQARSSHQEQVAPAIDPEKIQLRVEKIKEKLDIAEATVNEETAKKLGVPLTSLQEHNSNLRKMQTIYQRQLTSIERRNSLKKETENLGTKFESKQESLIAQPPPYNLSFHDILLDELTTARQHEQTLNIALKSAKKVLEEAINKLEQAGKKVRDATEGLQASGHTDKSLQLNWQLEDAKAGKELAMAFLDLQRIITENAETELRLAQLKKQINQHHVDWVQPRLAFDQEDLDKLLASQEERRTTLQTRINTLRQGQQGAKTTLVKARNDFEAALGADEAVKARATAFLKSREAWSQTYQIVLEQTETILLILDQEKQFYQHRYALLENDFNGDAIDSWEKQSSDYLENLERLIKVKEKDQTNLQSEIAGIQKQLVPENLDPDLKKHLETHMAAMNKMAERGFEYLSHLQGAKATGQRFLDEINLQQKDVTLKKKIKDVGSIIQHIWETELWVVDERSVSVRKLVIVLFILVVGAWVALWCTGSILRRLLLRTRLDKSAIAAIEKILFFLALVVLLVFALRFVNIPLTVFAFLGGAIAIGIGFGAQNLLNNFISGFILLTERPVKINDMIEVENNFGIIENIGMRCTRVRTHGNVHILVPNSIFLERNIVNWTLSDHEIRASVTIGVAHSSNPHEVSRLMTKAAQECKKALETPTPIVLFNEISDSSFQFIIYFWVSMKNLHLLERRIIESGIRFRIIKLFRQAGIVLAYKQHDVHLDTSKSLNLRLIGPEDDRKSEGNKKG